MLRQRLAASALLLFIVSIAGVTRTGERLGQTLTGQVREQDLQSV